MAALSSPRFCLICHSSLEKGPHQSHVCGTVFHTSCLKSRMKLGPCPSCKKSIKTSDLCDSSPRKANWGRDEFPPSLMEQLRKHWHKKVDDEAKKSLVAETLASREEWMVYAHPDQIIPIFEKLGE